MAFNLGRIMQQKQERECARLDDFAFRVKARTIKLVAIWARSRAAHPGAIDPVPGGSDIVQLAPASMVFVQGEDQIAGVKLTARGLHRYYACCCRTPLGNVVSPAIPFVGVAARAFASGGQNPDDVFGRPIGAIKGEYAIGGRSKGSKGIRPTLFARSVYKVLWWKLTSRTWPHPFNHKATGQPKFPVTTLA